TMKSKSTPKLAFSALAFGLQAHRSDSNNQHNYNGTYTFASLFDYCGTVSFAGTQCQALLTADPTRIPGPTTSFAQTSGNGEIKVSQMEFAMWAQGDWRWTPRADISFGLRYQAQQHFNDYNN